MIFPKLHIELEKWKWNEEYGFWVSNLGNFKDELKRDVRPKVDNNYLRVVNWKTGKTIYAHRLVLLTWQPIDNPNEMTVDHLDHNKRNNKLKNLEWVPEYENLVRATADNIVRTPEMEEEARIHEKKFKDFYFIVNNKKFDTIADATNYVKNTIPYLDAILMTEEKIKRVYKKLINAYNNKEPVYLSNGFIKRKYDCDFTIILKGE